MSWKRRVVVAVLALAFVGSPAVRADVPAPALWQGALVGESGLPAPAELVAYARPAGLGLAEGSVPLWEIARTRTDSSGHYVVRTLPTEALRSAEDRDGWINVMVVAFGDDGSFTMAFDSISWVPAGGFSVEEANGTTGPRKGRWVTTPAERLAAEAGEIRALSADATEDPAKVATERPATMVLSGHGEPRFTAQGVPWRNPSDRNCMGLLESKDLDVALTKVGELHAERDWSGYFEYTSARSTSFQVGVRQSGQGWSVGGSTSSMQNSQSTTYSDPHLAPAHMYNFAADLKYGWYKWRCYGNGNRWYEAESVQPYTWKGGIHQYEGGNEPGCDRTHMSPIPAGGGHQREDQESATYEGGIAVSGFIGSVTTTIAQGRGVRTEWNNQSPEERMLCGERWDIADTRPNRIRSLP